MMVISPVMNSTRVVHHTTDAIDTTKDRQLQTAKQDPTVTAEARIPTK